jgi:hypothetical protein
MSTSRKRHSLHHDIQKHNQLVSPYVKCSSATAKSNIPPHQSNSYLGLIDDVNLLHHCLSQSRVPEFNPERSTILEKISSCTGRTIGNAINDELQRHFNSRNAQVTEFRASAVYPFNDNEQFWPILEWREGDDSDGLAIFDMGEDLEGECPRCSYIIHYGLGGEENGSRWKQTSLVWNVTSIDVLRTLFQAAHHALGILQMPKADALTLYVANNKSQEYTVEEYESFSLSP